MSTYLTTIRRWAALACMCMVLLVSTAQMVHACEHSTAQRGGRACLLCLGSQSAAPVSLAAPDAPLATQQATPHLPDAEPRSRLETEPLWVRPPPDLHSMLTLELSDCQERPSSV